MARKKKKVRIALPEGVTLRDVKQAIAHLRSTGVNKNPLDVAVGIVAEREAIELVTRVAEAAVDDTGTLS